MRGPIIPDGLDEASLDFYLEMQSTIVDCTTIARCDAMLAAIASRSAPAGVTLTDEAWELLAADTRMARGFLRAEKPLHD